MAERHYVADEAEFGEDGDRVIAEVDGREIAVFQIDGAYYALLNYCVHQAGPLCEGRLKDRIVIDEDTWEWGTSDEAKYVECPWHTWQFDVTTGEHVGDPSYRVPTYDVEIDDGKLYIRR